MKKKMIRGLLCTALCLVLAFTLLPGKAAAARNNEQLGLWFAGSAVYAKGNAIILENGGDGYTKIKVGSSYVDFSQLTYSNGEKMYDVKSDDSYAAQLSSASIFGGWQNGGSGNTSITMNGGNVEYIYGGSGDGNVNGNATITIKGGRVQRVIASGWGGSVNNCIITVSGGTVSSRIETVHRGVTGDAALVITGGSVANIYKNYTSVSKPGGELSVYTRGIGQLQVSKDSIDNYVILEGKNWSAKGNTAKAMNGNYLTVNAGETLTVPKGQTFSGGIDNYGTIYNYGTISDVLDNQDTVHNYGTISAEVTQDDVGTIYNYGTVGSVDGGYVTKEVNYTPYYCTRDQSQWLSKDHNHLDDYKATLIPNEGHVLDDRLVMKVEDPAGDKFYYGGTDFTYDPTTGKVEVPNALLTGPAKLQSSTMVDLNSPVHTFTLSEDTFTYNGAEHKPTLLWNGSEIDPAGFTSVQYENNVNAGTGKVTYTGGGEWDSYTGEITLEFTIKPGDVEDVAWTVEALTYNGKTQFPAVSGKLGEYDLQSPADYLGSGAAQKNAGDYTLTVEGKGNFTGTKTLDWSIQPADINDAEATGLRVEYNGRQQGDDQVVLSYGGATLEKNVDYWFYQGSSGNKVGSYKQVIRGMGNFTGSKEVTVEIIPKKLTVVEVRVEDKGYDGTTTGKILEVVLDGLGTGSVEVDYAASTAEFATPEVGQNKTVTGTIYLTGTNAPNYEAPLNYTATGNIFNDFYAQQGKEYTVNTNDWTNGNFEVQATEGFTVSTVPNGTFGQSVAVDEEGEGEITFYVKRLSDGRISNPVKETYRIDKTAPTGGITIGERSWEGFFVSVYDKITNQDLDMKVTAADALSGVEEVVYIESETALTVEELAVKTGWTKGDVVTIKAEDGKNVIFYARITDKAGNVAYLASNGTSFDTLAPGIAGVKEGVTYYVSTDVTVNDKNLESVKLNGEEVGASFTIEGGATAEYTIVATDKAGNETKVSFKTGSLADAEKQVDETDVKKMTREEELALRKLLEDLKVQNTDKATDEEKAKVTELIGQLEALLPAATPNTGDLLLPIAGAVCVIALLGIVVVLILKKKHTK